MRNHNHTVDVVKYVKQEKKGEDVERISFGHQVSIRNSVLHWHGSSPLLFGSVYQICSSFKGPL